MIIEDAKTRRAANVINGFLRTASINTPPMLYISTEHGDAFGLCSGAITIGTAGERFLVSIRNDSEARRICVMDAFVTVDHTETASVFAEVGLATTWSAGTEITPTNYNSGSTNTLDATVHTNAAVTGLQCARACYIQGGSQFEWDTDGAVILDPGGIFYLKVTTTTDGAKVFGSLSVFALNTIVP